MNEMLGIVVADKMEVSNLPLKLITKTKIGPFIFYVYRPNIVLVCSGVGLVKASAATQTLINHYPIKEIWNYGAVGGDQTLNLFDLVAPQKIYFHDVFTPWYPQGQLPEGQPYYYNALKLPQQANLGSGNSFIVQDFEAQKLSQTLKTHIYDMEAAGIAQIAHLNHIPFKTIKCVSDLIGSAKLSNQEINANITKAGEIALRKLLTLINIKN